MTRQSDLLVAPKGPRWVVEDRGIMWVSDRFILARADLFTQTPRPLNVDGFPKRLTPTMVRSILAEARGTGDVVHMMWRPTYAPSPDGEICTVARVRSGLIFMNRRVSRSLYALDLRPRYVHPGHIAWWGERRGKPVLCAVLAPVSPLSFGPDSLSWEDPS